MSKIEKDSELRYYASILCEYFVPEMDGYTCLCHEPKRMEDPIGLKKCVVKYCPKLNKTD